MTVVVSFVTPKGVGSLSAPAVGRVRVRENIAVPGTTTATLDEGEVVVVSNGESSMVAAAMGTTPDAAATAATALTQAGVGIGAGASLTLIGLEGEKVNVKAVT